MEAKCVIRTFKGYQIARTFGTFHRLKEWASKHWIWSHTHSVPYGECWRYWYTVRELGIPHRSHCARTSVCVCVFVWRKHNEQMYWFDGQRFDRWMKGEMTVDWIAMYENAACVVCNVMYDTTKKSVYQQQSARYHHLYILSLCQ